MANMWDRKALQFFIILIGITSLIFILVGANGEVAFTQIGYKMAYAVCALLMLDLIIKRYQIQKIEGALNT